MSVQIRGSQRLQGDYPIQKPSPASPQKAFFKLLEEKNPVLPETSYMLSDQEQHYIRQFLSYPVFPSFSISYHSLLQKLVEKLFHFTGKRFFVYLRGSYARQLIDLPRQIELWVHSFSDQELSMSWEREKRALAKKPPPNDVDFILFSETLCSEQDLQSILQCLKALSFELFGKDHFSNAFIPTKNNLTETNEPLVIASLGEKIDFVIGSPQSILCLFSLDSVALFLSNPTPYAVSFRENFMKACLDAVFRKVRIEKRHQLDFRAYLAALQHVTNGYCLDETEHRLRDVANKFIGKEDPEKLIRPILKRIEKHSVDPFRFIFHVCIWIPDAHAEKRETLWRSLLKQVTVPPFFQTIADAPFPEFASELFHLSACLETLPEPGGEKPQFPTHFSHSRSEGKETFARLRLQQKIFAHYLKNRTLPIHALSSSPYTLFLSLLKKLDAAKKNSLLPDAEFLLFLKLLSLSTPEEFDLAKRMLGQWIRRDNFDAWIEALLKTPQASAVWEWLLWKNPSLSIEEHFLTLIRVSAHEKVLEKAFRLLDKPSAETLIAIANLQCKVLSSKLLEKIGELLKDSGEKERLSLLKKFPKRFWEQHLLNRELFDANCAKEPLQILFNENRSLAFLWKAESTGVFLELPAKATLQSLLKQVPQKALQEKLCRLLTAGKVQEFSELLPFCQNRSFITEEMLKISLSRVQTGAERYQIFSLAQALSIPLVEEAILEEELVCSLDDTLLTTLLQEQKNANLALWKRYAIQAFHLKRLPELSRTELLQELIHSENEQAARVKLILQIADALTAKQLLKAFELIHFERLSGEDQGALAKCAIDCGQSAKVQEWLQSYIWHLEASVASRILEMLLSGLKADAACSLLKMERREIRERILEKIRTEIKPLPEEQKKALIEKIPADLRLPMILDAEGVCSDVQDALLQHLYEERPSLSLLWLLEERGKAPLEPNKKLMAQSFLPSAQEVERRRAYLFRERRFLECLQLPPLNESYIRMILCETFEKAFHPSLPQMLQIEKVLPIFLELCEGSGIEQALHHPMEKGQLEALFKILSLPEIEANHGTKLKEYFLLLLKKEKASFLSFNICKKLLKLPLDQEIFQALIEQFMEQTSDECKTLLQQTKHTLFEWCKQSPENLYALYRAFCIHGVPLYALPPKGFQEYLSKSLETEEKNASLIQISLKILEESPDKLPSLSLSLFGQIARMQNSAHFSRWLKIRPPSLDPILERIQNNLEWLLILLKEGALDSNEEAKTLSCLFRHPLLDEELSLSLISRLRSTPLQDLSFLPDLYYKFPRIKRRIMEHLAQWIALHTLSDSQKSALESVALMAIQDGIVEPLIENPQAITSLLKELPPLSHLAVLALPKLLHEKKLQLANKWGALADYSKLDAEILIEWLRLIVDMQQEISSAQCIHLLQQIAHKHHPALYETTLPQTLRKLCFKIRSIQEAEELSLYLCGMILYLLESKKLPDDIQEAFYLFLISAGQVAPLDGCLELVKRQQHKNLDLFSHLYRSAVLNSPQLVKSVREAILFCPANREKRWITEDELDWMQILIQSRAAILQKNVFAIRGCLEMVNQLHQKDLSGFSLFLRELMDEAMLNGLAFFLKENEIDTCERLFYEHLGSLFFNAKQLTENQARSLTTNYRDNLLHAIEMLPKTKRDGLHRDLNKLFSFMLPPLIKCCQEESYTTFLLKIQTLLLHLLSHSAPDYAYEKTIEAVLFAIYNGQQTKAENMWRLSPLLQLILQKKTILRDLALKIRCELWINGAVDPKRYLTVNHEDPYHELRQHLFNIISGSFLSKTAFQQEYFLLLFLNTMQSLPFTEQQVIEFYTLFYLRRRESNDLSLELLIALIRRTMKEFNLPDDTKVKIINAISNID